MNSLFLLLLLAIFMLPSLLVMRKQRRRQSEMAALQADIGPGDRIITVSGVHGVVIADGRQAPETAVRVEVADGTVITMERECIVRRVGDDLADNLPADLDETYPAPGTSPTEGLGKSDA